MPEPKRGFIMRNRESVGIIGLCVAMLVLTGGTVAGASSTPEPVPSDPAASVPAASVPEASASEGDTDFTALPGLTPPSKVDLNDSAKVRAEYAYEDLAVFQDAYPIHGYSSASIAEDGLDIFTTEPLDATAGDFVEYLAQTWSVKIRIDPAAFDREELAVGVEKLNAQLISVESISGYGPSTDRTGFDVGLARELTALEQKDVKADFESVFPGAAISYFPMARQNSKDFLAANRYNDTAPYNPGTLILKNNSESCTAGFRAKRVANNVYVLLTADHCSPAPGNNVRSWPGYTIGPIGGARPQTDSAYINALPGSSFTNAMFYGPWSTETGRSVAASSNPALNTTAFANGGVSGQSTQNVTTIDFNLATGTGYGSQFTGPFFKIQSTDLARRVGHGDSGGPVWRENGSGVAVAKGLMSQGSSASVEGSCAQGNPSLISTCFATSWAGQIDEIEATLGVVVE
jgi:hypothetical protein